MFNKRKENQYGRDKERGFSVLEIKSFVWEVVKVVVISLAIVMPVRKYLIQPFYVKGASMEPNFYDHEYLIIDEINYRFNDPQRGEIIVFRYPYDFRQYFIKRIVGLPGERVRISGGDIFVYNDSHPDGIKLDESAYLQAGTRTAGKIDVTLGENEYFVMGDNRSSSLDSRSFGPITGDDITGRTWLRGWPVSRASVFGAPEYNF